MYIDVSIPLLMYVRFPGRSILFLCSILSLHVVASDVVTVSVVFSYRPLKLCCCWPEQYIELNQRGNIGRVTIVKTQLLDFSKNYLKYVGLCTSILTAICSIASTDNIKHSNTFFRKPHVTAVAKVR